MTIKNFQDFQATRDFTGNLKQYTEADCDQDKDGFVYAGNYTIQNRTKGFDYFLVIENTDFEDPDLMKLEYILYAYCNDIGVFDNYTTLDAMSDLYTVFCQNEDISRQCAYEKLQEGKNTPEQELYLKSYNTLWDYYTNNNLDSRVIK